MTDLETHPQHPARKRSAAYVALLSLGALGVVFGDIGTSPLYAFRESLAMTEDLEASRVITYGIASLMFWAMMLIVTLKYVVFVMRADNHGEGGILALTALVTPNRIVGTSMARRGLILIGVFGTALLYGDGIITPAISVLSAVEGLEIAAPSLSSLVVPIAAAIIVLLFSVQRRGTASIGAVFGPVMIAWFGTLAVLGVSQIATSPGVVAALSPTFAIDFVVTHPGEAFRALGAVFLVVTGSEALYADMGHFGRSPIRLAWFTVALPALTLNYLGQAALVTADPAAADNPFFRLAPSWSVVPLVVLATAATVIASQALITGAYSLTMQAVQLGYLPRVHIDHTSPREFGQVYVASINWILMVACVALVFAFGSSANLAAAYGIAVTSTMVITTLLLHTVMRERWNWSPLLAAVVTAFFAAVDVAFFSANVLKIAAGGWVPLVVALLVFAVMLTWQRGRRLLDRKVAGAHLPIERFIGSIASHPQKRVEGTAVFMIRTPGTTPPALIANLRSNEVLHETIVLVSVRTAFTPTVTPARRHSVHPLGEGFFQVVLTFGFMEDTDVPTALSNIVEPTFGFDLTDAIFFLGREVVSTAEDIGVRGWPSRLFALMHRNARSAAEHFKLPIAQVVEIGIPVRFEAADT